MIPNPILKVLSTLTTNQVRHLLMGGQACVLYGGAEFSRDTDVLIVADADYWRPLRAELEQLRFQRRKPN